MLQLEKTLSIKKWPWGGTSQVVQWLRICLLMQGTWVRFLVQKDSTCHRATKPVDHDYQAHTLEPVLLNKRIHCNEKPLYLN